MEKAKSSNKEKVVDALEGMEFVGQETPFSRL
jgi:hypothetical protein